MSHVTRAVARCGHDYIVSGGLQGPARKYGDCTCKPQRPSRSESSRLNALARWDKPGMRERAAEYARKASASRWANRTERPCHCGHAMPYYEGRYKEKCDACALVCAWDGCAARVPSNRKFCAEHVAEKKRAALHYSPTKTCSESGCERPLLARGLCNAHYKAEARAGGRIQSEPWNERRKNNQHVRRARAAGNGVGTERVTAAKLLARDGSACGICLERIDFNLAHPDPMSKSIDHIVPIARGGAHSLENCQLAHLRCNVSKGARVA